jgi:hypothetical protein
MINWRSLNDKLSSLTEQEVIALLEQEKAGKRRLSILRRLHQRYCVLRTDRERIEILSIAERD